MLIESSEDCPSKNTRSAHPTYSDFDRRHCYMENRRLKVAVTSSVHNLLLCASFVISVSLWWMSARQIHHKGTEFTKEAQRKTEQLRSLEFDSGDRIVEN